MEEAPVNSERHSYFLGNSKGLRSSVPGTGDKDQIYLSLYHTFLLLRSPSLFLFRTRPPFATVAACFLPRVAPLSLNLGGPGGVLGGRLAPEQSPVLFVGRKGEQDPAKPPAVSTVRSCTSKGCSTRLSSLYSLASSVLSTSPDGGVSAFAFKGSAGGSTLGECAPRPGQLRG